MDFDDVTTARPYLRVSYDRSGRERSNDDQLQDADEDSRGRWALLEPYSDVGSASRYAKRTRGDFQQLIADLSKGTFGAEMLVLWESSRGSRKVGEWVELLDLCDERHVFIRVTSHNRTYDPSNPRDRRTLLEDAVDSEYESGKTSLRVRRDLKANAKAGRPHGRMPYGYKLAPITVDGRIELVRVIDDDEAEMVRDLFKRIIRGDSLTSISRDWNESKVPTKVTSKGKSGRQWYNRGLVNMVRNKTYIGVRVHNGTEYPGTWDPIVNEEDFHAANTALDLRVRRHGRKSRRTWLNTVAVCGECESGGLMGACNEHYLCVKGCVSIKLSFTEDEVSKLILKAGSNPDVHAYLATLDRTEVDHAAIARVRDSLKKLRTLYLDPDEDMDDQEYEAQRGKLQARLDALQPESDLVRMNLASPETFADYWKSRTLEQKGELAALFIHTVRITKARCRGVCDPGRLNVQVYPWVAELLPDEDLQQPA